MVKLPTAWSNSSKTPSAWSRNDAKVAAAWVNNIVKQSAIFSLVLKNTTDWSNESVEQVSYVYDSPTMTYDDASRGYDYLTPVANQTNNLNPTPWAGA